MKVLIEVINKNQEEEICIRCHEVNNEINQIVNQLKLNLTTIVGHENDKYHQVKLRDVYYFEAVEGKVFIYCKDKVYEVKNKLYEIEEMYKGKKFFRASKSTIINIAKISHISPSFSGRFEALLDNGERLMISRKYVPNLKTMLGL
ncbi:LytTR family DNA-binding domain-containing protein [Lysinibacillus endophyticus]|uniref:LytTR family transcriptional regulator n=1 Tax=Ureibacillus endophyticus TaxID=1978490 RepID=A0A494YYR9_9BACL|nr:LytTR family DNA-binding domain-containing protein [Lysinibacillus endophyticus]MCP1146570.1 LytTR family transcriptional regulator DNA-binding domain-containing protein [Lysinibacillus endophyticus]RKQ15312.1 LytTR family transcriptional regulator [Lysinibacillus endophyticus]